MNKENLLLYIGEGCPFCRRVTKFIEKNNLDISIVDSWVDTSANARLVELGGRATVPCLVFDDKEVLYESSEIVNWLSANLVAS